MENEQVFITGTVEHITFRNEENGYTVMTVSDETGRELTAVGTAPPLGEGETVELAGRWTVHREYGKQLAISACHPMMPQGTEAMERFLGSGLIRGCGPSTAKAIVRFFGKDTADVLSFAPHRLQEVPGIGPITAEKIADSYRENAEMREVITGLSEYGVTVSQAIRIAREYGRDGVMLVRENPSRLADEVFGIGFKTADAIARNMGVEADAPFRINAGLRYSLQLAAGQGHTCLPSQMLCDFTATQLGADLDLVCRMAARMVQTGELMLGPGEDEPVYTRMMYACEQECAVRINKLAAADLMPLRTEADRAIAAQEKRSGIKLSDKQRAAVLAGLENTLSVITGGPGTGKTTIVQFLLSVFDSAGLEVALCAPTGRAAKRMTEATGREAKTIHRLLEYSGGVEEDGFTWRRDEENPLTCGALIVDEMSMVDIFLLMRLTRALRDGTRVIFIGDADQLPSVGPGYVLHDIIDSGVAPVIALDTVYRQGEGSAISLNAHRINRGEMPACAPGEFELIDCRDTRSIRQAVSAVAGGGNVQVITPMRRGDTGVDGLNGLLQDLLNSPTRGQTQMPKPWKALRTGDKVMQTRNDYRLEWTRDEGLFQEDGSGVFNGEMGVVELVDTASQTLTVLFEDGRRAEYAYAQTEDLQLSYAISIHKSQGSEFENVAIVLSGGPPQLYSRNLLYTAVTRARKKVWIIGPPAALNRMVNNNHIKARYSGLRRALKKFNEL